MFKKLFLAATSVFLVACAGQPALPPDYQGPVSMIQETAVRVDRGKAQMFFLSEINGVYVSDNSASRSFGASIGKGNNLTIVDSSYEIPAEKRTYKIVGNHVWAMDGRGLLEADLTVSGEVTFMPEEGRTYLISGSLGVKESVVWIKDTVTDKILAEFKKKDP